MRHYLPFWPADKIYEEFDPSTEAKSGATKYIWEVFERPPIDGILVSRMNLERHKSLSRMVENKGIHEVLRFKGTIAADCGAWGYINQKKPPYDPAETISFYKKMGFDIGVTVDHPVVRTIEEDGKVRELTQEEREERCQITLENGKKGLDAFRKGPYEGMRLIGAVQASDPESYGNNARELIEYGFDYIGLGGLARRPTQFLEKTLTRVGTILKKYRKKGRRVDVHIFGAGRRSLLDMMQNVGVTSFDSASQLRDAWVSPKNNYYLGENRYVAIRMREKHDDPEKTSFRQVLELIERFENGAIGGRRTVDEIIQKFPQYDPMNPRVKKPGRTTQVKNDNLYPTFEDKPWEKCDCSICRSLGIHTCIFRMSERNMRRGFHNVYQFHKFLSSRYKRILVFTQCSQEKDGTPKLMPAYRRYLPSPVFKAFWRQVHDLPVEIAVLSAKYGFLLWNQQIGYYDRKMTRNDLPEIERALEQKLRDYDRVYFAGLGLYREAVERVSATLREPVKIFPSPNHTHRAKIDIIELLKQMKDLRTEILKEIPHCNNSPDAQRKIAEYQ